MPGDRLETLEGIAMSVLTIDLGALYAARTFKQNVHDFLMERVKLHKGTDTLVIRCDRQQFAREDVARLAEVFATFDEVLKELTQPPSPST